jgi:hypothetical protein
MATAGLPAERPLNLSGDAGAVLPSLRQPRLQADQQPQDTTHSKPLTGTADQDPQTRP